MKQKARIGRYFLAGFITTTILIATIGSCMAQNQDSLPEGLYSFISGDSLTAPYNEDWTMAISTYEFVEEPNKMIVEFDTIRVNSKVIFDQPIEGLYHDCNEDSAFGFAIGMFLWVVYFLVKNHMRYD